MIDSELVSGFYFGTVDIVADGPGWVLLLFH